jgi:hypothetical protein
MNRELERSLKIRPFNPAKSDGCTFMSWPYKQITGKNLPFRDCCISHDEDYWYGGTKQQRRVSDDKLRDCVYKHNRGTVVSKITYWLISRIMWIAVRVGGSPKSGLSIRWGFNAPMTFGRIFGGYDKEQH